VEQLLLITGFLPPPDPDEFVKYEHFVVKEHEQAVLDIMGWHSLDDGGPGTQEMTVEQVRHLAELLCEPPPSHLVLFIETCTGS
jgi:hypothetical protein